jgi:hypothetical protein
LAFLPKKWRVHLSAVRWNLGSPSFSVRSSLCQLTALDLGCPLKPNTVVQLLAEMAVLLQRTLAICTFSLGAEYANQVTVIFHYKYLLKSTFIISSSRKRVWLYWFPREVNSQKRAWPGQQADQALSGLWLLTGTLEQWSSIQTSSYAGGIPQELKLPVNSGCWGGRKRRLGLVRCTIITQTVDERMLVILKEVGSWVCSSPFLNSPRGQGRKEDSKRNVDPLPPTYPKGCL